MFGKDIQDVRGGHNANDRRRSIVNEAAEESNVKPMVNMGQGFFGALA